MSIALSTTQPSYIPAPTKKLKKVLIIAIIVLVLLVGGLVTTALFMTGKLSIDPTKSEQSKKSAAAIVASDESLKLQKNRTITSDFGFSITYDTQEFTADGQYTDPVASKDGKIVGETYSGDELNEQRPYSIVRIGKKSANDSFVTLGQHITITTNIRANYWDSITASDSKIDALVAKTIASQNTNNPSYIVSDPEDIKIGDIEYKKITVTDSRARYGISTPYVNVIYLTVQHDRPYTITLDDVNKDDGLTSHYEAIITSIKYGDFDTTKLGSATPVTLTKATLAVDEFSLPENTSNIPDDLDENTLINVVAKNQPATVRVLTIYCADIQLQSGEAQYSVKNACSGGVGSGSFISGDGYVATNGHVVTVLPQSALVQSLNSVSKVATLVEYLVKAGKMTADQGTAFVSALNSGDSSATSAIPELATLIDTSTVKLSNDEYHFALQLGNDPVRIDRSGTRTKIEYTDTIIEATFIDKDYDEETSKSALSGKSEFTTSDVALLKAEGSYPSVKLGSIDTLKKGDRVTAIGFPAFIDNAVNTDKWQTVPSLTQGTIKRIVKDSSTNERNIIQTNVPIAQGNSGGPSFNDAGEQIGLNTYASLKCSDQQCFGDGTIRDVADLKALVKKNNIALASSSVSDVWNRGLDAYSAGNYKLALELFERTNKDYPANYLASPLSRLARAQLGTDTDTSSSYGVRDTVVTIVIIVALIGLLLIAGLVTAIIIVTKRHHKAQQNTSIPTV